MTKPTYEDLEVLQAYTQRQLANCQAACIHLQGRLDVAEQDRDWARAERDTANALRIGTLR